MAEHQGTAGEKTLYCSFCGKSQHECDHLWGKLYPMRIRDFSRFGYIDVLFPELKDN